jgi:hypothetical protein
MNTHLSAATRFCSGSLHILQGLSSNNPPFCFASISSGPSPPIVVDILIAGVGFLLSYVHFQAYLQKLVLLEKKPYFYSLAVRCMCALLDTAPHFNFRESLLANVVKNLSSSDNVVR